MIGNVIKSIRIVNNKSECELKKSLEVSQSFILKIENGEKSFSLKNSKVFLKYIIYQFQKYKNWINKMISKI